MGSSSSGKKHKKDKKHRHRSHSRERLRDGAGTDSNDGAEVTLDLTGEAEEDSSSTSRHRHHHKHKKHKEHRHKHHHKQRERERRSEVISLEESDSDSSDCVVVPVEKSGDEEREFSAPPPPLISKHADYERERRDRDKEREKEREREKDRERERERDRERERERERQRERYERDRERDRDAERERYERDRDREAERERYERDRELEQRRREREVDRERNERERERESRKRAVARERSRSKSPIPENGAGDVLSIEETNKLRAKLGLKPLEVDSGPSKPAAGGSNAAGTSGGSEMRRTAAEKDLSAYKDEWGEFLHKPADNIKEKKEAEKIREKLKQRKEKRFLEERLARIRTLGESDEEHDDVSNWVQRNKRVVDERKEAERRAKALEEMDAEFGVQEIMQQQQRDAKRKAYNDKHLKGLTVEHDMDDFTEGRTVILTLKDHDVLDEEGGDTLVNVNMLDDERYKKNVQNKKAKPQNYGYDVYEEQYDEFGNPIERAVLEKYDEDIDGQKKRQKFVIGENLDEEREHRRKLLEIKTKLAGKRLETLQDTNVQLASDTFSVEELAKFKKPKKKVKKLRQKLKADDLVPLADEQNFGSRNSRYREIGDAEDVDMYGGDVKTDIKVEEEDDDLQRVLSKARKLKQKENIIKKPPPTDLVPMKEEIKDEAMDENNDGSVVAGADANIILNATAEFCRTLGDIPTYGMAGNRNEDTNDMMDFEVNETLDEHAEEHDEVPARNHGTWNSVNPDEIIQPADLDNIVDDVEERAILDEEPDVGAGVANALRLALSKGYLEKEEKNRPSNSKMAHLQAKNYSIEDKAAGEDDKFGRRDRFHSGPIMDFKDKETFKPNVKLEYIDDNGRVLNLKEAFRYLSHKFHGKGPGKNKIEKRLKKMEQEGLMKTMSSTDTPLGTLTMLQQKQKETKTPYVVLSGSNKSNAGVSGASIAKFK